MADTQPQTQDGWLGGPLATELATYEAKRAELVREAEGSYVLIKGTEVVGLFPTEDDAYEEAVGRFGARPFMIREVRERDDLLFIPVLGTWQ